MSDKNKDKKLEKEEKKVEEEVKEEKSSTEERVEDKKEVNVEDLQKIIDDLKKENDDLKHKYEEARTKYESSDKEIEKYKNKYLEAYADMQNVRRMVEKEANDFKDHAIESFVKELIPSLDSFDMALKKKPEDEACKKYVEGFEMIHRKLLNSLKQCQVEVVEPAIGEEYNPDHMNAFSTIPGKEDNKVVDVFTKGYKLKGHLLRPAGVVISMKAEEETAETAEENK